MNLDERMRERLRAAADAAEQHRHGLDAKTTERIVAAAVAEARREKRRRSFRIYSGMGAVTALAAGALVFVSQRGVDGPDVASVPEPTPPRCMALEQADVVSLDGASPHRHELGARARVDATSGTLARIETPSGCESRVTLVNGSVTVWARDLAGGSLEVAAGDARVIVHGTVFEVRSNLDGTRYVAVREGRVEVRRPQERHWLVDGQALEIPASGASRPATLDASALEHLQAVLGDVPPTEDAAASATQQEAASEVVAAPAPLDVRATLRAADAAYRAGDLAQARRLFRQVGSLRGSMAEAAWIRLGRLELRSGHVSEAAQALAEHRRRFPSGGLAAEARVAEAQALRSLGRAAEAAGLEQWVIDHRPDSPQARALRARRAP